MHPLIKRGRGRSTIPKMNFPKKTGDFPVAWQIVPMKSLSAPSKQLLGPQVRRVTAQNLMVVDPNDFGPPQFPAAPSLNFLGGGLCISAMLKL